MTESEKRILHFEFFGVMHAISIAKPPLRDEENPYTGHVQEWHFNVSGCQAIADFFPSERPAQPGLMISWKEIVGLRPENQSGLEVIVLPQLA